MKSKIKLLFIGPYRQDDNWGRASLNYVRALTHTNCDISLRPIYMGNRINKDIQKDICILENKRHNSYNITISHCLPNYFTYLPNTHHIGLCHLETNSINNTPWQNCINYLDELWVCSEHEKNNLVKDKIDKPINVVPISVDETIYNESYEPQFSKLSSMCVFYYMGAYEQRKNILKLLTAFYREFNINEQVQLVIQVQPKNNKTFQELQKHIQNLQNVLRLYKNPTLYPKAKVVVKDYTAEDNGKLHTVGDIFINIASGESYCYDTLDAMGYGNPVIYNSNTGISQYTNIINNFPVISIESPIVISDPPIPQVYNARNTWYEIDIINLQKQMRAAFDIHQDETKYNDYSLNAKENIQSYTHLKIGIHINKLIESLNL